MGLGPFDLWALGGGCWPGLAPAGDLLSFASPKESRQRKGDPAVGVPALRSGQPAVLAFRGVRSNTRGPDPRKAALLGTPRRAWVGPLLRSALRTPTAHTTEGRAMAR